MFGGLYMRATVMSDQSCIWSDIMEDQCQNTIAWCMY